MPTKGRMSIENVLSTFKGEWVGLDDIETTEALEVISGLVIHHSQNRKEVYEALQRVSRNYCTVIFAGTPPQYTNVNLNLGLFY